MVFGQLQDALVGEVFHAEDTDCKCNLVGYIPEANRVQLTLADCLHLAGGPYNTDLVEAVAAGRLLDE